MSRNRFLTAGLTACLAAISPVGGPAVRADSTGETMRAMVGKHKGAAVTLVIVISMSAGAGGSENMELEVAGVMIDPSGLVVTANSPLDPALAFNFGGGGAKITTRVVSAKILMPDGNDIPARVVLRDSDLNLAFLRPVTAPKTPLPFVNLKAVGKAQLGDNIFLLSRMGATGNRQAQVRQMRIVSVLDRPRTLYILDTLGLQNLGTIAFNEQGEPLGLVTMRAASSARRQSFIDGNRGLAIIVPGEDILEEAAQAPKASAKP